MYRSKSQRFGFQKFIQFCSLVILLVSSLVIQAQQLENNDQVLVFTDVMLDDDHAIKDLLTLPRFEPIRSRIAGFVTSSGNAVLKAAVLKQMIAGYGYDFPVYAGTGSNLREQTATEFAADFLQEGRFLLPETTRQALLALPHEDQSGNPNRFLKSVLQKASVSGSKVHVLGMGPFTDVNRMIKRNPELSSQVLGLFGGMGGYKYNGDGSLAVPFNAIEDAQAAREFADDYREGKSFKHLYTVPSDTMNRIGFPNGYFPANDDYAKILFEEAKVSPVSNSIMNVGANYATVWPRYGGRTFGVLTEWFGATIMNQGELYRYYLADPLAAELFRIALTDPEALKALELNEVAIKTHSEKPDSKDLILYVDSEGKGQKMTELKSFDGHAWVAESMKEIADNVAAKNYLPANKNFEVLGLTEEAADVYANSLAEVQSEKARSTLANENFAERLHEAKGAAVKTPHSLLITFKNAPDDWISLLKFISDPVALAALKNGGIIAEGYDSHEVAKSLKAVLSGLGAGGVVVAIGHNYDKEEVTRNGNLSLEHRFWENGLVASAFKGLKGWNAPIDSFLTPEALIKQVIAHSKRVGVKATELVLGEGVDRIKFNIANNHALDKSVESVTDMGGGRQAGEEYLATRNWAGDPKWHIEQWSQAAKYTNVHVFDSTQFSGAMMSVKFNEENFGSAETAITAFEEARGVPEINAVLEHSVNWSRNFEQLIARKSDPKAPLLEAPQKGIMVGANALYMTNHVLAELHDQESSFERHQADFSVILEKKAPKVLTQKLEESPKMFMFYRDPNLHHEASIAQEVVSPAIRALHFLALNSKTGDLVRGEGVLSDGFADHFRSLPNGSPSSRDRCSGFLKSNFKDDGKKI